MLYIVRLKIDVFEVAENNQGDAPQFHAPIKHTPLTEAKTARPSAVRVSTHPALLDDATMPAVPVPLFLLSLALS